MKELVRWEIAGHTLRAGRVTTDAEREVCYRLRYAEYFHQQHEIPEHWSGLDIDEYDDYSTMFCTTLDDNPAPHGTMRFIHCERRGCLLTRGYDNTPTVWSGRPYEFPQVSPATGEPVLLRETVEGSRFSAKVITLSLEPVVMVIQSTLLLEAGMEFCRQNGIKQIIGALREHQWANLVHDGWPIHQLYEREDGKPHILHKMDYRDVFIPVPPKAEDYFYRQTVPTDVHRKSKLAVAG